MGDTQKSLDQLSTPYLVVDAKAEIVGEVLWGNPADNSEGRDQPDALLANN